MNGHTVTVDGGSQRENRVIFRGQFKFVYQIPLLKYCEQCSGDVFQVPQNSESGTCNFYKDKYSDVGKWLHPCFGLPCVDSQTVSDGFCEWLLHMPPNDKMMNHQVQKTLEFLKEQEDLSYEKTVIHSLIGRFKEMRSSSTQEEEVESARRYLESDSRLETTNVLDNRAMEATATQIKMTLKRGETLGGDVDSDDGFGPALSETTKTRGRGRGRGRGSRGGSRGSSASKASASTTPKLSVASWANASSRTSSANKSQAAEHMISDDDEEVSFVSETTTKGKGRGARTSTSFRASGRSSVASNGDGNRTLLDFKTRKAPTSNSQSSGNDLFSDFPSASPRKKARIMQYADDSD